MDESKSEIRGFPECDEGPDAASAFQKLLKKALATPPAEIKKRDKQWREKRAKMLNGDLKLG
jgi:hypothetical protein